ncbi:hypothetical protein Cch01nite_00160 [Cellulomonas chitinilytica]|uniref:Uncharacterized protein n=1 Tax=Cellulomonas chitinilytica TaxID=398759 RepID=A0A919NZD4_9CELL|nr:hypothetical protein [Cellulomonas chitinilytica]GIG19292.1 hypothetical protein Cch01nite_00160 [Cellulomonas chitinilytica]
MPVPTFKIRYDRRVSPAFLGHFVAGGVADRLRVIAQQAALPLDLQMRKNPKSGAQHATLYAGLTAVLNVKETRGGLRLGAHPTWSEGPYGFSPHWGDSLTLDEVRSEWSQIELYLERVVPKAVRDHGMTEGAVQSVVSRSESGDWAVLDREVIPSFVDTAYKRSVLDECMAPMTDAAWAAAESLDRPPASLGAECDLLAVDADGRLLAIEVKPLGAGTIAWVPAQATMYARVLQRWIDVDGETALDGAAPRQVIAGMLAQRQSLGQVVGFSVALPDDLRVTPVVVLQKGAPPVQKDKMRRVRDALARRDLQVPQVELYEVSILGDFERID